MFDDFDINTIDLNHLRSFFGIVRQEPLLFNGSIKYNICYNKEFTVDEIEESAKNAFALDFINE